MGNRPMKRHVFSAIVLAAFFAMPLYAIAQTESAPQVMQQNDITYVTGGIGDDEKSALEASKGQYNLQVLNANKDGAFVDETTVAIKDHAGNELVSTEAGPLFYAKLPAGAYTVTATHHGESKSRSVRITKASKATKIGFAWKPAVEPAN